MTVTTYPDHTSRTPRATNVVDATAGAETLYVANPDATIPGTEITVVKGDAGGNAVTVADGNGTLATLNAQNDAVTIFSDGAIWVIKSLSSSEDAGSVAAALAAHETETEVHGADGDVTGVADVETLITGAAVVQRITEIHTTDVTNAKVVTFSPGGATPVNSWVMNASGAGDPLVFDALGSDTDISISFAPKGAGKLMEALTPVALESGDTIADAAASTATDSASSADGEDSVEATSPTVAEFNALVAEFDTLVADHNDLVTKHNTAITDLNAVVTKFNLLIAACESSRVLTP